MALPTSGKISLGDVNVELGRTRESPLSLGNSLVRSLSGLPNGKIGLNDLKGKSLEIPPNSVPIQLTGVYWYEYQQQYIGFSSLSTPVKGSVSPLNYRGVKITGIQAFKPDSGGSIQVAIYFETPSSSPMTFIKGIVIGGLTFTGLTRFDGTSKVLIGGLSKVITAEQFEALRTAIVNKTTTVYFLE